MQQKSRSPFAAAKWILGVGTLLLVGVIGLTSFGDKRRKPETADASSAGAPRSERSAPKPAHSTHPGIAGEVPPWVAAQQKQEPLPPGLVPASEINPPPPERNEALPPTPVEPPNPATHRP